jgi:hypothetical protein
MINLIRYIAQTIPANEVGIPTSVKGDLSTLDGILSAVYTVAGIICIIVIVVAGYMYTTSAGNASSVTKAKNAILFAVIGLVVIIIAFGITRFITGRF